MIAQLSIKLLHSHRSRIKHSLAIQTLWWQIFGWIVNYLMPHIVHGWWDRTHENFTHRLAHYVDNVYCWKRDGKYFLFCPIFIEYFSVHVWMEVSERTCLNKLPANIDNQKIYVYDRFRMGFIWDSVTKLKIFYDVKNHLSALVGPIQYALIHFHLNLNFNGRFFFIYRSFWYIPWPRNKNDIKNPFEFKCLLKKIQTC